MITIVALGNPGEEYAKTRHNVGWMVMRSIIATHDMPSPVTAAKYGALLSEGAFAGAETAMLFPSTFMNNSGVSVRQFLQARPNAGTLVVVHDEIDLPFGEVRLSRDRGAGGHNGVRSIIAECGTQDFVRVRIGIRHKGIFGLAMRPKGERLSKFVLGEFTSSEMKAMPEIAERVDTALALIAKHGAEKAMQEVNM